MECRRGLASSDENSVCPSVRLSNAWIVAIRKKDIFPFFILYDARRFWHDVYRLSNAKATTNVITVGGKVGDSDIAEMWKQHYEQLYCEKYNEDSRVKYLEKITMLSNDNDNLAVFSIDEVQTATDQQKCGKAVGPDNVPVESYKYGGHRLAVYLMLFFKYVFTLWIYFTEASYTIVCCSHCKKQIWRSDQCKQLQSDCDLKFVYKDT